MKTTDKAKQRGRERGREIVSEGRTDGDANNNDDGDDAHMKVAQAKLEIYLTKSRGSA